ncbi:IS66 family insertion sequence element accessory protein TnpA [Endozoicomonas sp.]|uniref:IS66 family insertion sequence element accessory protein TnpA n=1 Tax=Endozoicomonas sp. TaxID=1892382 RepID=UPI00383AB13D
MSSKRMFWFQHIEAWHTSDLSQAEYARQHQLSIKSFGYYRRRYVGEHEQPQSNTVKATLLSVHIEPEVSSKPQPSATGISLTYPEVFALSWPPDSTRWFYDK